MNGQRVPWETCQTFSGSWGYYRDETSWKSVRQLLAMLVEVVSKGGNLLLNVGPTARGTFDDRALERLAGMGRWMDVNGRSVYGCTAAPAEFPKPANCLLTYNAAAKRLYVHVLEWPMGTLSLEGFGGKVQYAQLLNDASEVRFRDTSKPGVAEEEDGPAQNAVILSLPVLKPNAEFPVIELFLK